MVIPYDTCYMYNMYRAIDVIYINMFDQLYIHIKHYSQCSRAGRWENESAAVYEEQQQMVRRQGHEGLRHPQTGKSDCA